MVPGTLSTGFMFSGRLQRWISIGIVRSPLIPLISFHCVPNAKYLIQHLYRGLWQERLASVLDFWVLLQQRWSRNCYGNSSRFCRNESGACWQSLFNAGPNAIFCCGIVCSLVPCMSVSSGPQLLLPLVLCKLTTLMRIG